jgi:hypothetical protein
MRGSIHPARLTRSWRAHLLAAALLLSVVSDGDQPLGVLGRGRVDHPAVGAPGANSGT